MWKGARSLVFVHGFVWGTGTGTGYLHQEVFPVGVVGGCVCLSFTRKTNNTHIRIDTIRHDTAQTPQQPRATSDLSLVGASVVRSCVSRGRVTAVSLLCLSSSAGDKKKEASDNRRYNKNRVRHRCEG